MKLGSLLLLITVVILFTSCMITLRGIKFKVLLRNYSSDTLSVRVIDDHRMMGKVGPLYTRNADFDIKWRRVNGLKDTIPYSIINDTVLVFQVLPNMLVDMNGLLSGSDRLLFIEKGKHPFDTLNLSYDHVLNNATFEPMGMYECLHVYDVR